MRKKVKKKRKSDVENRAQAAWNRTQPPENRTQEPPNKAQSQNKASNGTSPCPSSWHEAQAIPGSPSCESTKSLSAPCQQAGSTAHHVSLGRHIRTPSTGTRPALEASRTCWQPQGMPPNPRTFCKFAPFFGQIYCNNIDSIGDQKYRPRFRIFGPGDP